MKNHSATYAGTGKSELPTESLPLQSPTLDANDSSQVVLPSHGTPLTSELLDKMKEDATSVLLHHSDQQQSDS